MATLFGTYLQKLSAFNLNSLFMKSTFTNDEDQENEASGSGPDQCQFRQDEAAVRKRGFYSSNLVLDTNHHSVNDQVTTRAQRNRLKDTATGNAVARVQDHNQKSAVSVVSSCTNYDSYSSCNCPAAKIAASLKMGAIKFFGSRASSGRGRKNRLPTTNTKVSGEKNVDGQDVNVTGSYGSGNGCCKCDTGGLNNNNLESECQSNCQLGADPSIKKKVHCFHEAPHYLRFNPHITHGYRGMLRPVECIKSLFWWTNETMNIWTHLVGWLFFLALSVYDFLGLLDLPNIQPLDKLMLTGLLLCFQACMLLSSLYHIFCCHSEVSYRRWLSLDLLGVSLSLLAIYVSGIYYAFSCVPFWLNFYLVTVGAIFSTAMFMQILPIISKAEMVTEERFRWRLFVFGGWAAYGVVPTIHWAYLHGMAGPAVSLLLPRIFGVYALSAAAFFFYVTRIPEHIWPGLVNYIGSSHQIWHILIVAALYHWHNTGMLYLQFRAAHPCADEYEYLFGVKYTDVIE